MGRFTALSLVQSVPPALLPFGLDPTEAVLQPLPRFAVGCVGELAAELVLLVPQPLASRAVVFAVAWRRAISRRRVARSRRIPRSGIGRPRRGGLPAIADQVAIVVADIADASRDVESGELFTASMGSAADRAQGAALHSKIAAALLVGARWQPLTICGES